VLLVIGIAIAIFTVVAVVCVAALLMGTDRRRLADARPFQGLVRRSLQVTGAVIPESVLTRTCSATVQVDLPITADEARAVALSVLRKQSRKRVEEVAPWQWTGWSGMGWRSWGQELTIAVHAMGSEQMRFVCASRPRYEETRIDWGASDRAAKSLADEVRSLAPRQG
jgi:hypothetical protein